MKAFLAPILFLVVSVTAVQSQIIKGPANALRKVGDSVTMECLTSSKNCDHVEWKKMEGAQSPLNVYRDGIILNGFPRERYSVNATGGCNLIITQLEISDSGRFTCELAVGDKEETRHSVLVVIGVIESCQSNVPSNALNQDDVYSFSTSINVPAKSVEPSNVTLYFQNKTAYETEKMDDSQSQTVKTTLTGIAGKENITQRVCMVSFPPNTAANFDSSTATLDVCTTQQLIVSSVQSQIIKGPVNALERVGDSVTLECITSSKNCDQVEWKKLEGAQSARTVFTNGIIINGFTDGRYSINNVGGCNLIIRELEVNDSGRFSCVLTVDDREETRSSILVVIGVIEACQSNVTSNALNQNDSYSFSTAINVPAKSVEPSNVTLSFLNKDVDETEITDDSQPPIIKTTLTGIARKANISQRVCLASFSSNTAAANFDRSTATLDVCTTKQLIVSLVQSLRGPVNALKRVGDNVTLECVTSRKNCDLVEWKKLEGAQSARTVYKNGIILNGFRDGRYSLNNVGGCNLTIGELKVSDSGRFSCVLAVGDRKETRGSILVVISVIEPCLPNVTSNSLVKGDGYSFRTAINVPDKSVEPSNVILSFQNKIFDEAENTDDTQSLTVKTTLTGIARRENITQRLCRASLRPYTADGFDRSIATLDICNTHQLIVSYPVERVTVWPNDGKFHEGTTINCIADGYPMPTFMWRNMTSGLVVQSGSSLNITKDSFGHIFTCIATNTVNGKPASEQMMAVVGKHSDESDTGGCSSGCIAGITVFVVAVVCIAVGVTIVVMKKTERGRRQRLERSPSAERETTN